MQKYRLILNTIFILYILGCSTDENKYIKPHFTKITESVYSSATIKTNKQYLVYSKTNGIIDSVFISEGMKIKLGDTLFTLDDESTKINTKNAILASSTFDYDKNKFKLKEAENTIHIARQNLKSDSIDYQRQKNLWDNDIGSKIELEQKKLRYENSILNLKNAELRYNDLKKQLKYTSDQAINNLKMAKITEDNSVIKSKINGLVYQVNIKNGELVNNLNPLAIIGTDEFYLELNIDEVDITKIKIGQKVIVKMNSYKNEIFEAEIFAIDPIMNERTRSFTAKAKFIEAPNELFLNLTAETNIIVNIKEKALTIPRVCLINDSLIILKNNNRKKVKTGLKDYEIVEIIDGIDENTEILIPEE